MAIAFDVFTDGLFANPGTSNSWNHTCTGSNRYLLAGTNGDSVSDLITGVTANATPMSKLGVIQIPNDRFITMWGLLNPASGVNAMVASASSSIFIGCCSASYTGVNAQDAAAVTNSNSGVGSITATVTTIALNAWTVALFANDANTISAAGAGTTTRGSGALSSMSFMDSNAALAAGVHTLQATNSAVPDLISIIISLAPFTGAAAAPPQIGRSIYVMP